MMALWEKHLGVRINGITGILLLILLSVVFAYGVMAPGRPLELLVVMMILFLLFLLFFALFFKKIVMTPLSRLEQYAFALGEGKMEAPVELFRQDELGQLAKSLNTARKFINVSTELLSKQVVDRTVALHEKTQELEQAQDQIIQSEKMAGLGRLVSGFAHELNTPIGVAVTAATTLQEASDRILEMLSHEEVEEESLISNLDTVEEATHLILSNLRRAAGLVASFKRTSVDQTAELPRSFSVKEVTEDVISSLQNKFKRTKIEIQLDCPEMSNVFGLPGVLDQILTNLLINSLDHGFEKGKRAGAITLHFDLQGSRMQMIYADTGRGIEAKTLAKIFEPFFTTNRDQGGTGLGMYICYNLVVVRLGGTIECFSKPGEGVRFHISFPVQTPSASEFGFEVV